MADPIKRATETSKNFLEEQKRRAQQGPSQKKKRPKAGIGNLPGKKKEDFIIVIDDKYISDPNKFGMNDIVIMNPEKKAPQVVAKMGYIKRWQS